MVKNLLLHNVLLLFICMHVICLPKLYCHTCSRYNAEFCSTILYLMNYIILNFVIGIHNLPDPIINEDGHYHSSDELYGTSTTEKDLPSASMATQKKKQFHLMLLSNMSRMLIL